MPGTEIGQYPAKIGGVGTSTTCLNGITLVTLVSPNPYLEAAIYLDVC